MELILLTLALVLAFRYGRASQRLSDQGRAPADIAVELTTTTVRTVCAALGKAWTYLRTRFRHSDTLD